MSDQIFHRSMSSFERVGKEQIRYTRVEAVEVNLLVV